MPAAIVGHACVVPASSCGPCVVLLGHLVKALLSLVKCLLFAIIVSSVLIIGTEQGARKPSQRDLLKRIIPFAIKCKVSTIEA